MTTKLSPPSPALPPNSVARLDELRWRISDDVYAADAALELLREAVFYIACGRPLPGPLRDLLCDGLEHLEQHDPVAAFGHLRAEARKGRGRRRLETDAEWLTVLADVIRLRDAGFPLTGPDERYPFKQLEGTAFAEYAARHAEGNAVAINKEARRVQAGFWKHVRTLPAAQIDSLRLAGYLPRKK